MKTYLFTIQIEGQPLTAKNLDFKTDAEAVEAAKADPNVVKVMAHDGSVIVYTKEA